MSVPFEPDESKYPPLIREHLHKRKKERRFTLVMGFLADKWIKTHPVVPTLVEAPAGWYKRFNGFTILGEGPYWKTVYTPISGVNPRRKGAIDLDAWLNKQGVKKMQASIDDLFGPIEDDDFTGVDMHPGDLGLSHTKEETFKEFDQDYFSDVDEHPGSLDLWGDE